jgi:uncharacterized protein YjiS (DUF1127 family)
MERTMSKLSSDQKSLWSQARSNFGEWRRRSRSRQELMGLDEITLADVGLTRGTADMEATKPFWMS